MKAGIITIKIVIIAKLLKINTKFDLLKLKYVHKIINKNKINNSKFLLK